MFNTVAQYIIGVLVAWVCAAGAVLIHKYIPVAALAKAKALAAIAEQEIAAKNGVAYDAVRLVEDLFPDLSGAAQLAKAETWAAAKLTKLGIDVTPAEIDELVRIAYQDFAAKVDVAPAATPVPPTK